MSFADTFAIFAPTVLTGSSLFRAVVTNLARSRRKSSSLRLPSWLVANAQRHQLREAFRVVKPGGVLHCLGCSPWVNVCSPANGELPLVERLEQGYFEQHKQDWGAEGVDFNLPLSGWFRLFHEIGWTVLDYLEPRPTAPAPQRAHYVTLDWAYRYPAEQVWKLRKARLPEPI